VLRPNADRQGFSLVSSPSNNTERRYSTRSKRYWDLASRSTTTEDAEGKAMGDKELQAEGKVDRRAQRMKL
jgi:hypothetical protein